MLRVTPNPVPVNRAVVFDASDSSGAIAFEWDLDGDGAFEVGPSTARVREFVYLTAGTRRATVRVTDVNGAQATAGVDVVVTEARATVSARRPPLEVRLTRVRMPAGLGTPRLRGSVATYRRVVVRGRFAAPRDGLGTLRRFRRARWRARVDLSADVARRTVRVRGHALVRFRKGRGRALRADHGGQPPQGGTRGPVEAARRHAGRRAPARGRPLPVPLQGCDAVAGRPAAGAARPSAAAASRVRQALGTAAMKRAALDGLELEYELRGAGEPVVLLHWGMCAAWARPLQDAPALRDRYRLLSYDRAGFGASGPLPDPPRMADHAEHCLQLMRHVGIERAHVVGHSSSAMIALQLALDAPEAVHTLALLESARPAPQTETQARFARDFAGPALERYREGDTAAAIDTWCRGVFGEDYRAALEHALPEALEQAVADADAFFGQELPAVQAWSFGGDEARRIEQPALLVLGEDSVPTFAERRELLLSWLPNAEPFDLPGATHLLHVQNPAGMADALAAFYARHPLP